MGKKSIFSIIKERGFGEPVLIVTKINHYKSDDSRNSYTAYFPEKGDFDTSVSCKNRLRLAVLIRDIAKRFTTTNKQNMLIKCNCGKMMSWNDGCVMGAYGPDTENCREPFYYCECGNEVEVSESPPNSEVVIAQNSTSNNNERDVIIDDEEREDDLGDASWCHDSDMGARG